MFCLIWDYGNISGKIIYLVLTIVAVTFLAYQKSGPSNMFLVYSRCSSSVTTTTYTTTYSATLLTITVTSLILEATVHLPGDNLEAVLFELLTNLFHNLNTRSIFYKRRSLKISPNFDIICSLICPLIVKHLTIIF